MKYLLTGGGTGGHVYPLIAIAAELQKRDSSSKFLYVGVTGKADEKILKNYPEYPFKSVCSIGFPRSKNPFRLLSFLLNLSIGIFQSLIVILKFRPSIIIGSGGFASAPVYIAGILLRKKIFVHEQNLFPGLVNRYLGRFTTRVGLSFRESMEYLDKKNSVYTGYPVRLSLQNIDRALARRELSIPETAKVLFVFGGSQGARSINIAFSEIVKELLKDNDLYIIHGTGRYKSRKYDAYEDTIKLLQQREVDFSEAGRYRVLPYIDNIETVYAASDIVVGRAGAGTIMELASLGKPAILIPKVGLPGNHQEFNAQAAASSGGVKMLLETREVIDGEELYIVDRKLFSDTVQNLINSPEKLKQMQKNIRPIVKEDSLSLILNNIADITGFAALAGKSGEKLSSDGGEISFSPENFPIVLSPSTVLRLAQNGKQWERETEVQLTRRFLASQNWRIENIGIKLAGVFKLPELVPDLVAILKDKTPAGTLERLVGGDFRKVGFIRRNAFISLGQIGEWTDEMAEIYEDSTNDPYWETAVSACRSISTVYPAATDSGKSRLYQCLLRFIKKSHFEVLEACLITLATIPVQPELINQLRGLYTHPNRKVKIAVAKVLNSMQNQKLFSSKDAFLDELTEIFIPGNTE